MIRAAAFLAIAVLVGCGSDDAVPAAEQPSEPTIVAMGDLDEIRQRGVLRLARTSWDGFDTLPRQGLSVESYFQLAAAFAEREQLAVQWVLVDGFDELMPAVLEGRADVAVANITVTPSRAQQVAFTLPLTKAEEWIIGQEVDNPVYGVAAHAAYADSLDEHFPESPLVLLAPGAGPLDVVEALEAGRFDVTVMDENNARTVLKTTPELTKLGVMPDIRELAWTLRPSNPELLRTLNGFLAESHFLETRRDIVRSWEEILEAGRLRLLTVNGPGTYYLWRGELIGFEYELVKRFAKQHELTLEVVVAPDNGVLLDWLKVGRGDLVSAGLTDTANRRARGVAFSVPYLTVDEVVVSHAERAVERVEQLAGRTVTVNPETSYFETLGALTAPEFDVATAEVPTERLLEMVLEGGVDVTVADSHLAGLTASFDERLTLGPALAADRALAWAVPAGHEGLLAALDGFLGDQQGTLEFNVLRRKYFENRNTMSKQRSDRIVGRQLSPYDDLVQQHADAAGFDWRLIVAQMYQESRFNPKRRSHAGARGLLQVLPRTARELDVDPSQLTDPATGIETGVRYLDWTRRRFSELAVDEQTWFALAAYNAGIGHVRDARRLAKRQGWDSERWFDHVERAMLLLSKKQYSKQAMHGYVRGEEPVRYVGDIRKRYQAYVEHLALIEQGEM